MFRNPVVGLVKNYSNNNTMKCHLYKVKTFFQIFVDSKAFLV